jgi:hypothetical protein
MPKGGIEDGNVVDTARFVQLWNDWSTAGDRQQLYAAAWRVNHRSALAFVNALADARTPKVSVPAHIAAYLTKHDNFSPTFFKAFKKVKKYNWRLGVVVDQTDLTFPPALTLAENKKAEIVMLYVVGDNSID